MTDRTPCPPDHRHAESSTCYIQHRCGCAPCTEAARQREQRRVRAIAYGRHRPRVDAEPVRERIRQLMDAGVPLRVIAARTRVHLTSVMYGPRRQRHIGWDKAERILAYQPSSEDLAAGAPYSARGTRRRLQALVALGWPLSAIAERVKLTFEGVRYLTHADHCARATAQRVREVYDQLSMTLPPQRTAQERRAVTMAHRRAEREGWAPPLAWDDIDLDARPHGMARTREAAAA